MRRCFLINDRKACPVAAAGGGLEIFRVSGPLLSGTQQRGAAVKGMSGREITSVERVARQLCRAFLAGQTVLTTNALRHSGRRAARARGAAYHRRRNRHRAQIASHPPSSPRLLTHAPSTASSASLPLKENPPRGPGRCQHHAEVLLINHCHVLSGPARARDDPEPQRPTQRG